LISSSLANFKALRKNLIHCQGCAQSASLADFAIAQRQTPAQIRATVVKTQSFDVARAYLSSIAVTISAVSTPLFLRLRGSQPVPLDQRLVHPIWTREKQ
jgi:hypothetical protein